MNELLEPGYAGILSFDEAEYIRQKLEASESLKRKWGIKGKITLGKIAAIGCPEASAEARDHIRREMARAVRQNALKRRNAHKIVAGKM